MKKSLICIMALVLLLGLWGCGGGSGSADTAPTQAPAPAAEAAQAAEAPAVRRISLINARANDSEFIEYTQNNRFLARAVLPDKYSVVDHWEINGKPADPGNRKYSLEFNAEGTDVVEAFIRDGLNVECIKNCYIQFLDDNGQPAGDKYRIVRFEDTYTVPTTGRAHAGGKITMHVAAHIPAGKAVDYWLIDGAAYKFPGNVTGFYVIGLAKTTTYEVVLKNAGAGDSTPGDIIQIYDGGWYDDDQPDDDHRPDDDTGWGMEWDDEDRTPFEPFDPNYSGVENPGELFDDGTEGRDPANPTVEQNLTGTASDGHEHNWVRDDSRSWAATCSSPGKETWVCTICGAESSWTTTAAHNWSWRYTSREHWQQCSVCGATQSHGGHRLTTGQNSYKWWESCSVCGYYREGDIIN